PQLQISGAASHTDAGAVADRARALAAALDEAEAWLEENVGAWKDPVRLLAETRAQLAGLESQAQALRDEVAGMLERGEDPEPQEARLSDLLRRADRLKERVGTLEKVRDVRAKELRDGLDATVRAALKKLQARLQAEADQWLAELTELLAGALPQFLIASQGAGMCGDYDAPRLLAHEALGEDADSILGL